MKALVAVKRVADANVKIRVKPDHTGIDLTNVKMAMNPFCEIAVEEAVRLKEKGVVSEIVVVSVGAKESQEQLRAAMALGADRAILVETQEELGALEVAKVLKGVAQQEQSQLIFLGKQAIDEDSNQVGQMLAALLNIGQATFASEVVVDGSRVRVTREIDGGAQTLELALPALITTDLRLNEPRYAKLPNIMKAKKKPIEEKTPTNYGVTATTKLKTIRVETPSERKPGVKLSSVDELVAKLKDAKVI